MTNELEKQFFDTFGIEPRDYKDCSLGGYCPHEEHIDCGECSYWETWKTDYPEITSDILLELICILTRFYGELVLEQCLDVNDLKEQVLNIFIRTSYKDNFKHQVRTLLEEG